MLDSVTTSIKMENLALAFYALFVYFVQKENHSIIGRKPS